MDASETYRQDRLRPDERFDDVEPTISHLFRGPHPALGGRSFGQALYVALRQRGLLEAGAVWELGGGTGQIAAALTEESQAEGRALRYTLLDLSWPLLAAQRARVAGAAAVRAAADRLPFRTGALEGLFLANEVIADLAVERAEAPAASARVARYRLPVVPGQWINMGALALVEELARVLAPGAAACLTEFGGDGPPGGVALEGQWGRGLHQEFAIQFPHLEAAARELGMTVEKQLLADFLGFDRRVRVASYPDCVRLRRLVPKLPVLAHPREVLVARHPFLTRFFAFDFPEVGSPRFPDPKSQGGFCQVFWALLLRRPAPGR